MFSIIRLVLVMVAITSVTGCATYPNPNGGLSTGFALDADTPIGGIDASVGVHNPLGHQGVGVPGGPGGIVRRPPGEATLGAMTASEPLAQWAAGGNGQGIVHRYQNCQAYESGQWANYNCSAGHSSSSTTIGGRPVAPPGFIMNGQGGQGGGSFQPQSFNMNGGGYRNDAAMVGPTGRQWQIVQPGRPVQPGSPYSYGGTNPNGPRIAVDRRIGGVGGGAPYRVY